MHMIRLFTILALVATKVSAAIDPEFVPINSPLILQKVASVYKAKPAAKTHHVALVDQDTDELLKGIGANNDAYIAFARGGVKHLLENWIKTILDEDGIFILSIGPGLGQGAGHRPAGRTRDDFIKKVGEIIDGTDLTTGILAPANASMRELQTVRDEILNKISEDIEAWITGSLMQGNGAFLHASVPAGLLDVLPDRNKNTFIEGIKAQIKSL